MAASALGNAAQAQRRIRIVRPRLLSDFDQARILVLSPHLDDAVLGVGELLSATRESVVATVFTGSPGVQMPASEWDRRTASTAAEVIAIRRREDELALAQLGARPIHLGFVEGAYRGPACWHESMSVREPFSAMRAAVMSVLLETDSDVVLVPVGLGHVDHRVTCVVTLSAWLSTRQGELWTWVEQPYGAFDDGLAHDRLRDLRASATPVPLATDRGHATAKIQAISAYRSQLAPLQCAFTGWDPSRRLEERVWRLYFDEALGRLPESETTEQSTAAWATVGMVA
jgi:LmbE family N-acetylglucosaminyl deacetylase